MHQTLDLASNQESSQADWYAANQRYLTMALGLLRARLERMTAQNDASVDSAANTEAGEQALAAIARSMQSPPALTLLVINFGLSDFERDLLLLCAALELDAAFAPLYAKLQNDAQRAYPTFSLALALLPNAHWSAITPDAPLRRWRLLEAGSGNALTSSPLRIDERVLHYLVGVQHLDDRLVGLLEHVESVGPLVPSQIQVADEIMRLWTQPSQQRPLPAVQLCGADQAAKRAIAAEVCNHLGLQGWLLSAAVLPTDARELDALMRLWEREASLSRCALLVDLDAPEALDAAHEQALARLIETIGGLLLLTGRERRAMRTRPIVSLEVAKPNADEQRMLWQQALGPTAAALNGQVDALVAQFSLGAPAIYAAATSIGDMSIGELYTEPLEHETNAPQTNSQLSTLNSQLWEACRLYARPRLDDLAQRMVARAGWGDLVLPRAQLQILHEIAAHVRQRATVYERWGFAAKSGRGLGISALFAGASGTGKTLAAEVLANALRLDLYRIDLSQVVSKYIGETEKNLRRVFDAAEEGGAVLLFDEADALFGKRSEVKDSHDRYANIEVSYLLQRMEAYRGLAILTTNMKNALDPAFLRRIRFIVHFPFPDATQRAEIWQAIFPQATPTVGLDMGKLARLNVAGGNIYNMALNAAFLAADAGQSVSMSHLLRAAQIEYAKLEKPLTESEISGWV